MHKSIIILAVLLSSFPLTLAQTPNPVARASICDLRIPFISLEWRNDGEAAFQADVAGGTVFVTKKGEIVYSLQPKEGDDDKRIVLREEVMGGSLSGIRGKDRAKTRVSFFKGRDPSKWRSDVPAYHAIDFGEVYPGITMNLYARGDNVEKIFHVEPGADPAGIRIRLTGAKVLRVNVAGELEAETALGRVAFTKPAAYQDTEAGRRYVETEYLVEGEKYGFEVRGYDHSRPLVIDPLLASTYLGGSGSDGFNDLIDMILDHEGNVYITGQTASLDFPTTPGVCQETHGGGDCDLFVSKLSGDLGTLVSSTFVGGSDSDTSPRLSLDKSGDVYVIGYTKSLDFPTTPGALSESFNGGDSDCVVLRLNADLTSLAASTYLGGSATESSFMYANGIMVNDNNEVMAAGQTSSLDFPTTPGAYAETLGGKSDVFVSKLDTGLTTLLASTFLGGSESEKPRDVVLNETGDVLLTGYTVSSDFPVTSNAFDTTYNGGSSDIFVSRLDNALATLKASTFLGGSGDPYGDVVFRIVLDEMENVLVTGYAAEGFPTTPGAFDETHKGAWDGFIAKLDGGLASLLACTFLSGPGSCEVYGYDLVLDEKGDIYAACDIYSPNFPVHAYAYDDSYNGGGDGMVAKFDADLSDCLLATYLGGNKFDSCFAVTMDSSGHVVVSGRTGSSNFPMSPDPYDDDYNGGDSDIFVCRLDEELSADSLTASPKTIKALTGGKVTFTLKAGGTNAGRNYLVVGGVSGTEPGCALPGGLATLPVNLDAFTYNAVFPLLNTVYFTDFMSTLDSGGQGQAYFNAPPFLPPAVVGVEMFYAYCLNGPFDFASIPVKIEFVP